MFIVENYENGLRGSSVFILKTTTVSLREGRTKMICCMDQKIQYYPYTVMCVVRILMKIYGKLKEGPTNPYYRTD